MKTGLIVYCLCWLTFAVVIFIFAPGIVLDVHHDWPTPAPTLSSVQP